LENLFSKSMSFFMRFRFFQVRKTALQSVFFSQKGDLIYINRNIHFLQEDFRFFFQFLRILSHFFEF